MIRIVASYSDFFGRLFLLVIRTSNFRPNAVSIHKIKERVAYLFVLFLHFRREMDPLKNAPVSGIDTLKFRVTFLCDFYAVVGKKNVLSFNLLKPNGHLMHQQVKHSRILHSAHTILMCFIFISEQMATFAHYIIN